MTISIKRYLNEKSAFFLVLLITMIILISPYILRMAGRNGTLIGENSYYHSRMAETISDKGIIEYDNLSFQGRNYIFEPYHLVLSCLKLVADTETASRALIFLCGIASVVLFFLALKELGIEMLKRTLILFIFVLSPAFIYTFSVSNKYAIAVPFLLAGIYFTIKRKLFLSYFFIIVSSVLSLFNAVLAFVFLFMEFLKKKSKKELIAITIVSAVSLIYYFPFYYANGLPEKAGFIKISYFQHSIAGLGAVIGFSIFSLLLAIIGISAAWKNKKKLIAIYVSMAVLIGLSAFTDCSNIYLNFFICFFAGIGFYGLIERRWELKFIKDLVVLVIICGLLFSAASYINRSSMAEPDNRIKESLEWLNEYSNSNESVLSHYSKGAFIEYWAKRPVIMDSVFEYAPDLNKRHKDSEEIFSSRSLKITTALLNKYNIRYIWFNNEMRSYLVWKDDKEGLLFLLRNNETFRNIYNREGIEIWEVKEDK